MHSYKLKLKDDVFYLSSSVNYLSVLLILHTLPPSLCQVLRGPCAGPPVLLLPRCSPSDLAEQVCGSLWQLLSTVVCDWLCLHPSWGAYGECVCACVRVLKDDVHAHWCMHVCHCIMVRYLWYEVHLCHTCVWVAHVMHTVRTHVWRWPFHLLSAAWVHV